MRLLIAGGGTGGHLFPGIAVAEEFLARDPANQVLFVGSERGVEARVLPKLGYRLECIAAAGIRGKGTLSRLKGIGLLLYAYSQSRQLLRSFKPDLVLGVGGYASGPAVLAARGLQIPRFVHEQNAIPGMTNKVLAYIAGQVFISLDESARYFPGDKVLLTGNPLRQQILAQVAAKGESPEPRAPSPEPSFHILVFGGSLGAHAINEAMAAAAPLLARWRGRLTITHQTGDKDQAAVAQAYREAGLEAEVVTFIDDMAAAYHRADLVVCRAGATTIAEVTACGKPCLFIPFPFAVDDHQRRNAEALLKKGACQMLLELELSGESMAAAVDGLLREPERLAEMGRQARSLARLDAAKVIVDEMLKESR